MESTAPAEFVTSANDPLSPEHADIRQWVRDAVASSDARSWHHDVGLKTHPSGQKLLDADAQQACRYVMGAIAQSRHWDQEGHRIRQLISVPGQPAYPQANPHWQAAWQRQRRTNEVLFALTRRTLPFTEENLADIAQWIVSQNINSSYTVPIGAITRAIERFAAKQPISVAFRDTLRAMARLMRSAYDKDIKRHATAIEQLCGDEAPAPGETSTKSLPPPHPSPAGDPRVLRELKNGLGVATDVDVEPAGTEIGLDQFNLPADSPLAAEHDLLSRYFTEVVGTHAYSSPDLRAIPAGQQMLALSDADRGRLVLAASERVVAGLQKSVDYTDHRTWQSRSAADSVLSALIAAGCTFARDERSDFLLFVSSRPSQIRKHVQQRIVEQVSLTIAETCDAKPLSDGERYVLSLLRAALIKGPPFGKPDDEVLRLSKLIGDGAAFYLVPSEKWSVQVNDDIASRPPEQREAWIALLRHCLTATAPKPSEKWLKNAKGLVDAIGKKKVLTAISEWFSQVPAGRTTVSLPAFTTDSRTTADIIQEENAVILRGLIWIVPTLGPDDEMTRLIGMVGQSAYKKVPGVGPRAVKVGNSAVYALSQISSPAAVGQLAMLKVRVKFGTAQKEIDKAFNAAAEALQLPRDQIEEMGVPTYGLEEVGSRRETFDDISAELRVNGRDVELIWTDARGKTLKSVPAKVKKDHKADLKDLQGAAKDIAAMLPAQSERLDAMFLQQKHWPVKIWRERYLDHPLIGTLARRLIWSVGKDCDRYAVAWLDGQLTTVDDRVVEVPEDAPVQLWHPIGLPLEEVLGWRSRLERYQIRQPFKQAHRELYLLTDAERRTNTYSNRFAAHVLRQHQFNALCAARGWKSKLRLMVDDSYPPPSRELTQWALRAEFWIESLGDNYGTDTNDSGAFLRVATDQLRFYRTGAAPNYAHASGGGYTVNAHGPGEQNVNEPIPLDQIPPLVLSEILRDVDLFVGVASVGNDPTWQDGGPDGRYRAYWQSYSFGELSETAKTRKAVLQTLLPRLTKLRDRWTLDDKFLIIRGELRTYKIHLGSGNILMEPNDQYLCIVSDRSTRSGTADLFLPFEGDSTLSIILSKAFLLAEDGKITDTTITRQIKA